MQTLRLALAGTVIVLLGGLSAAVFAEDVDASRAPIPSAGCGTSDVVAGELRGHTIEVAGVERMFSARVPDTHDGTAPVPLWVYLHAGKGSTNEAFWNVGDVADEQGFVLASPQDLPGGRWNRGTMDTELDLSRTNADIAFIDALLDHLGAELCIDLARVYAGGYGNGGEATTVLACVLEDRIAATGAAASGLLDLGDDCDLSRPVPFLYIHGTADSRRPLEGGPASQPIKIKYGAERRIPDRVGSMAVRNGCEAEPVVEVISEGVERLSWTCPPEGDVGLVVVEGLGHVWPHAPVDAGDMLWEFFEQHPLPE